MKIIIDTREQTPFFFMDYPCDTMFSALHTGDYSIAGWEDRVTIERKSGIDLCGCLTSSRERFERELERMRDFEAACVIVECPLNKLTKLNRKLNKNSIEQSILSFAFRYRVPFFFASGRNHGEWLAFNCLRHFWNKQVQCEKNKIGFVPLNIDKSRM